MVAAGVNHDGASVSDLLNRIADLMAAYVNSEKGKKHAGMPNLLMIAAVSEIAAVMTDEPLLRDAAVRYAATTVDSNPRTHEPEGDKSLQSQEPFTMAGEDELSHYANNRARELIEALFKDFESDYIQLLIVESALSMLLANGSKNMEELLENISVTKRSIDSANRPR
jgi:hypothetical protein